MQKNYTQYKITFVYLSFIFNLRFYGEMALPAYRRCLHGHHPS